MVAIRPHLDPQGYQIIIKGNKLLSLDKNEIGIRHLFTTFIKEPSYIPTKSPVFNRQSDSAMKSSEDLKPLVFIFFAVPQQNMTVDFQIGMDIDLLNNIPNDFLGLGNISLRYHDVIWFAYRTKHMDKWPKYSHYIYSDGYMFPLVIGRETSHFSVELRMPKYQISQNILTISI